MPIPVYKPRGSTPLQLVRAYQALTHTVDTVSYAGRLDPMAEGVLLLLCGKENEQRRTYEHLSKAYRVTVVFGVSTDTGDLMGLPRICAPLEPLEQSAIQVRLATYVGTYMQRYHPYSSIRIKGKPLFYWAREGKLDQITIPTHQVTIDSIQIETCARVSLGDLVSDVTNIVPQVSGVFRQGEIVQAWKVLDPTVVLDALTITVSCASGGAYMRVLAEDLAHQLGTGGFAARITRTSVGPWSIEDCMKLR